MRLLELILPVILTTSKLVTFALEGIEVGFHPVAVHYRTHASSLSFSFFTSSCVFTEVLPSFPFVMLKLNRLWKEIDITVEEGLTHLSVIVETRMLLPGGHILSRIPEASAQNKALLEAAEIRLPSSLKNSKAVVGMYSHKKKSS
jgi:hypothetical protein